MERVLVLKGCRLNRGLGLGLTFLAAFFILGPLLFLAWKGLTSGPGDFLGRMAGVKLPLIVGQVLLLASATTILALFMAVPLAWLLTRSDLPGKGFFRWLAPLPLAIPPYVGAIVYQILMTPGGGVNRLYADFVGRPVYEATLVNIYGLGGAAWVLSLFTYPYLYLLASAALERTNPSLEEAARTAGLGPWKVFFQVTLPLLRPALVGGGLMVFLYAWADFGVVSLLRVRTLTTLIYHSIQGTMEWGLPARLSMVLSGITILVLLVQLKVLGRAGYAQIGSAARPPRTVALGGWRGPAFLYAVSALTFSLFLPLGVLSHQASRIRAKDLFPFLAEEGPSFLNSLWTAIMGATLAILLALAVGWLNERRRSGGGASGLFQIGYAIPGTVLGLGMIGFFHAVVPWLYATPFLVVIGYFILYITPAFQAVKAALAQLPTSLEEAARSLGRGPLRTFAEVTLPLIRPGLLGGWLLVFILSMRELAATLIVRPPGFDTLPVRIWIHTMDVGPEPRAALLALALVGIIALPWLFLLSLRHTMSFRW